MPVVVVVVKLVLVDIACVEIMIYAIEILTVVSLLVVVVSFVVVVAVVFVLVLSWPSSSLVVVFSSVHCHVFTFMFDCFSCVVCCVYTESDRPLS